eukprot:TRINITY_DN3140_c0_g1_i1.p1 TRINITY_DN3140_c0_g1~~TRINITY_DN3140_c0_g1_i1.p1  ORF type:complete len:654 (+),score=164.34 TRINITY_DN3140_c0_g1_i1:28-1962(+)
MQLSRRLRDFPTTIELSDKNSSEIFHEERQRKNVNFKIFANQVDRSTQDVSSFKDSSIQTKWAAKKNNFTQYEDQMLDDKTIEEVMKSDEFNKQMEECISFVRQELLINVMFPCFETKLIPEKQGTKSFGDNTQPEFKVIETFEDMQFVRHYSCVEAQFIDGEIFAAAFSTPERELTKEMCGVPRTSFIVFWSLNNPSSPLYILSTLGILTKFSICPQNHKLIVGCLRSGQVVLWNLDNSTKDDVIVPTKYSVIEASHSQEIKDVFWLPKVNVNENAEIIPIGDVRTFVTIGSDSVIAFWDLDRKSNNRRMQGFRPSSAFLLWYPNAEVAFKASLTTAKFLIQPTTLNIDYETNVFYVGTLNGEFVTVPFNIVTASSEQKNETDEKVIVGLSYRLTTIPLQAKSVWKAVCGPVLKCLTASSTAPFDEMMIILGRNQFSLIYKKLPVISHNIDGAEYSTVSFVPSNPCQFVFGRNDGKIEVWNLLSGSSAPVFVQAMAATGAITSISFSEKNNNHCLISDEEGHIFYCDLSVAIKSLKNFEIDIMIDSLNNELQRINYAKKRFVFIQKDVKASFHKNMMASIVNSEKQEATQIGASDPNQDEVHDFSQIDNISDVENVNPELLRQEMLIKNGFEDCVKHFANQFE